MSNAYRQSIKFYQGGGQDSNSTICPLTPPNVLLALISFSLMPSTAIRLISKQEKSILRSKTGYETCVLFTVCLCTCIISLIEPLRSVINHQYHLLHTSQDFAYSRKLKFCHNYIHWCKARNHNS